MLLVQRDGAAVVHPHLEAERRPAATAREALGIGEQPAANAGTTKLSIHGYGIKAGDQGTFTQQHQAVSANAVG